MKTIVADFRPRFAPGFLPSCAVLLGTALLLGASGSPLLAQSSLGTINAVGVNNSQSGPSLYSLAGDETSDGASTSVQASRSFTGLDGNGNPQTMTFNGYASSRATYGQLHLDAGGTVTNTYYNASNPVYVDSTGTVNPDGSPDNLAATAFCRFSDTFQYGGALQAGYQARYLFHVDGSNTGAAAGEYLTVVIAGHQQNFYNTTQDNIDLIYATMDYPINGQTPQTLNVTFSGQFNVHTESWDDGSTVSGQADYSDTATLAGIQVVDANGNPVSGVTIISGSGAAYPGVVPEPSTWAAVLAGAGFLALVVRRRVGAR